MALPGLRLLPTKGNSLSGTTPHPSRTGMACNDYPFRVYFWKSTMTVLKRKDFARWQAGEKLSDDALCNAVKEMENGLVDADLGGFLYKKRVARPVAARAADTGPSSRPGSASATCSCMASPRRTRPTSRRTGRRRCSSPARCSWNSHLPT